MCILLSCKPLFGTWSAFPLPDIPVWAGIQLIVGLCVNLDAASLMAFVIVFKSTFQMFSMFTAVNEYVCIVILSLVLLAFSSASTMAVISASSTDAKSLSLIIINYSLCTTTVATRVPHMNRLYSTCCRLVENGCILIIYVSVFPYGSCSHVAVSSLCRWVPPIVLMRVGDILVSQWSIHFVQCSVLWMFCVSYNLPVEFGST